MSVLGTYFLELRSEYEGFVDGVVARWVFQFLSLPIDCLRLADHSIRSHLHEARERERSRTLLETALQRLWLSSDTLDARRKAHANSVAGSLPRSRSRSHWAAGLFRSISVRPTCRWYPSTSFRLCTFTRGPRWWTLTWRASWTRMARGVKWCWRRSAFTKPRSDMTYGRLRRRSWCGSRRQERPRTFCRFTATFVSFRFVFFFVSWFSVSICFWDRWKSLRSSTTYPRQENNLTKVGNEHVLILKKCRLKSVLVSRQVPHGTCDFPFI